MSSGSKGYAGLFSWRSALGEHFVAHHDGSVSAMLLWDGEVAEMLTESQLDSRWLNYQRLLKLLPDDITVENHFWRAFDRSVADEYLARESDMVRGQEFGRFCRQKMYDHLAHRGMSNRFAFILTAQSRLGIFEGLRPKSYLAKQKQRAQRLLEVIKQVKSFLSGVELATVTEYGQAVQRSYHRDHARQNYKPKIDTRFHLNEQWIAKKPIRDGELLRLGETYTKVAVLFLYPDAQPGWFNFLANYWGVELHVSQVLQSTGSHKTIQRIELQAKRTNQPENSQGATFARGKMQDLVDFKNHVADNDLAVLRNCWILHIHSTSKEDVLTAYEDISRSLDAGGGQLRDGLSLDYLYWRIAMPGLGYCSDFMREDEERQLAAMMPILAHDAGLEEPSQLRLSTSGQLVGLSYPKDAPNHALNLAKTNSGKGVEKVVQICETYPLGEDWYIIEVGTSYEWVVQAFGGGYIHINPEEIVPNPFPAYADINYAKEETDQLDMPLPGYIVAPTMASMAFILTGGLSDFANPHQRMVAELAMQMLYLNVMGDETRAENTSTSPIILVKSSEVKPVAPNMEDYLKRLNLLVNDQDLSQVQREAAGILRDNLDSFLSTKEGSIFTRPDNFVITQGITGVDLDPLVQASMDKMAAVYLVNIALRYKQMALATLDPAHILMDELHEISRTHPDVVRTLIRQVSRMGRRQAAYVDAISQEEKDLTIDPTFARQCLHKTLLYMEGNHDTVRDALEIPEIPFQRWASFPNPDGKAYRPAIRSYGRDRYFDLFLTFPDELLYLAESSPSARKLKAEVMRQADDVFERLALFKKYRQKGTVDHVAAQKNSKQLA